MSESISAKIWDVIVVGAGMGGGIIGRRLAERGLSVLFVERGPQGLRSEQNSGHASADPVARLVRGLWPEPLHATIDGRDLQFLSGLGAGVGGTSAFYAATLERPEPHDIDHSAERPHPTGGWPVPFAAWSTYLGEAERLLHVCGGQDPLASEPGDLLPPPQLTKGDKGLIAAFQRDGFHPYQLHLGMRFLPGCLRCLGHKCPRDCKMDGRSAGVEPALKTGNAAVLDMCAVVGLRGTADQITHIEARRGTANLVLRGKQFVLAAGALNSPRILLSSRSEQWPDGCANSSGKVGRNLMFHAHEMAAIWPRRGESFDEPSKSIGLRDLYYHNGHRFGMIQSMGLDASYGQIHQYLQDRFDRSALRDSKRLRALIRVPALAAAKLFGNAKIFSCLIEDVPYDHNRVLPDASPSDRIRFTYDIADELIERRGLLRRLLRQRLRGLRMLYLTHAPELNYPHCCGTIRFGRDRATSVLDAACRAHDIRNLYVADSSFMPTSLGVNPSLMIAANALRVGDHLIEGLQSSAGGSR